MEKETEFNRHANPISIPANGWSTFGDAGDHLWPPRAYQGQTFEGLRFYTQGFEVRPRNQAVRLWKRTN